jgi:hypothetical protein
MKSETSLSLLFAWIKAHWQWHLHLTPNLSFCGRPYSHDKHSLVIWLTTLSRIPKMNLHVNSSWLLLFSMVALKVILYLNGLNMAQVYLPNWNKCSRNTLATETTLWISTLTTFCCLWKLESMVMKLDPHPILYNYNCLSLLVKLHSP